MDSYTKRAKMKALFRARQTRGKEAKQRRKFAYKLVRRAFSLTGVKIERDKFFRNELAKYSEDVDIERAMSSTPIATGMTAEQVDKAACAMVDFETKKPLPFLLRWTFPEASPSSVPFLQI